MNTDELLVQLDFDETNVNHPSQQQQQPQQQPLHSIDNLSTARIQLQRPSSPSALNTSEPILSASVVDVGDFLRATNAKPADPINASYHRRAFSDDNGLATVTQTIQQTHSTHSIDQSKATENHVNFFRSHSSADEDDEFTGHLEPTTEIIGAPNSETPIHNHLHTDDTVEVSLLADLSMDSRESQPLLGIGRDTHDYVHNNFPGKTLIDPHSPKNIKKTPYECSKSLRIVVIIWNRRNV